MPVDHKDVIIIGSGFGGSMTGLTLARAVGKSKKILILERGTWWTTPVSTVQDKDVAAYQTLAKAGEPVQYWRSLIFGALAGARTQEELRSFLANPSDRFSDDCASTKNNSTNYTRTENSWCCQRPPERSPSLFDITTEDVKTGFA